MPAKANINEQLYETLVNGEGLSFEIITGGVRYKAVLEHKEARERRAAAEGQTPLAASSTGSPVPGVTIRDSKERFGQGANH